MTQSGEARASGPVTALRRPPGWARTLGCLAAAIGGQS